MTNFDAASKVAPILHAAPKATPREAIKNQEGIVKFIYSKFYFYIKIKICFFIQLLILHNTQILPWLFYLATPIQVASKPEQELSTSDERSTVYQSFFHISSITFTAGILIPTMGLHLLQITSRTSRRSYTRYMDNRREYQFL